MCLRLLRHDVTYPIDICSPVDILEHEEEEDEVLVSIGVLVIES